MDITMTLIYAIALAFVIDMIIGDFNFHPVVLMGKIISGGEKIIRKIFPKTKTFEFAGGMILSLFLISISFLIPFFLLRTLYKLNFWAGFALEVIFCYQIVATRALLSAGKRVYNDLEKNDVKAARESVSMIVGRDKDKLDENKIIKAAIESVSENTSDGIVAPLFFLFIGGAPLGFLYKAVNTLDSMIAHKNERFLYFGKFAARADDVLNFIPSRLTGLLYVLAAFFLRYDYKNALKIFLRDRKNHDSPNSANIESACAGALDIKLGGEAYYEGKFVGFHTLGDDIKKPEAKDILRANNLAFISSLLSLLLFSAVRLSVLFLFKVQFTL